MDVINCETLKEIEEVAARETVPKNVRGRSCQSQRNAPGRAAGVSGILCAEVGLKNHRALR